MWCFIVMLVYQGQSYGNIVILWENMMNNQYHDMSNKSMMEWIYSMNANKIDMDIWWNLLVHGNDFGLGWMSQRPRDGSNHPLSIPFRPRDGIDGIDLFIFGESWCWEIFYQFWWTLMYTICNRIISICSIAGHIPNQLSRLTFGKHPEWFWCRKRRKTCGAFPSCPMKTMLLRWPALPNVLTGHFFEHSNPQTGSTLKPTIYIPYTSI